MMLETVAVCVIVVTGVLAMVQAYYVGKCFESGQPREDAHFNNEILKQNCKLSSIFLKFPQSMGPCCELSRGEPLW